MESLVITPAITWELIVVDNNSDDDKRNTVEAFKRNSDLPIEYLLEKNQGKSCALTPALKRPKGTLWHSPMMTALWTIAGWRPLLGNFNPTWRNGERRSPRRWITSNQSGTV